LQTFCVVHNYYFYRKILMIFGTSIASPPPPPPPFPFLFVNKHPFVLQELVVFLEIMKKFLGFFFLVHHIYIIWSWDIDNLKSYAFNY
jgi:hypothetical protein